MKAETTLLAEITDELTLLVEWLKEQTEKDTAPREFLNGLLRDLYVVEESGRDLPGDADQAAWLTPFLESARAKLGLAQRLFPDGVERIAAAQERVQGLCQRNRVLATLREEEALIREALPGMNEGARALLERGGVVDALRAQALLTRADGAGPPELELAGRTLEALALHLTAAKASGEPGPKDDALRTLMHRVQGFLDEAGAQASSPEQGKKAPAESISVQSTQRAVGAAAGDVLEVVSGSYAVDGKALNRAVVLVSPGAESRLVAAVRELLEKAPDNLRVQIMPVVEGLAAALHEKLDDPGASQEVRCAAALALVTGMRPLVENEPANLAPLLTALGEDIGQTAELIMPTPGNPVTADEEGVDVYSEDVEPGTIVGLLRPGVKLDGALQTKPLVQVSQGPPPPGLVDELLELLPPDDKGEHLRRRLQHARLLSAGDANAALSRELAVVTLHFRDPELAEAGMKAFRLVIDEPPQALGGAPGWEAVREFLDENLEMMFEDGEEGELGAFRLVRPYLQGLNTGELAGAQLRSRGEAMGHLLSLFDEGLSASAREWLFSELERLASDGLPKGGHTRRMLRTAAKSLKRFYDNSEATAALELTQALTRTGLKVYPEDDEKLEHCPDPNRVFHRLEAVYADEPRGALRGEGFEPAVAAGEGADADRESGAVSLSLGPPPGTIAWLEGEAAKSSRLGSAAVRLVKELTELDRERLKAELRGEAAAEREFAVELAKRITAALSESGWARSDEEREVLGELFEGLERDYHLRVLPGYLSYRQLKELSQDKGDAVKLEIQREGERKIVIDSVGAVYRDELLQPMDMTWGTGPPPPYVAHLRKIKWFDDVYDGRTPDIEMTPGATEAVVDFDSPEAQSLDGCVRSLSVLIHWLVQNHPDLVEEFTAHVKNAPKLELTFFPLAGQAYASDVILKEVERAKTPDAIEVVRDQSKEDGQAMEVERIALYQGGRLVSEEPRARFALGTLPAACEALQEALKPVLGSRMVTGDVKARLRGLITRLALMPQGQGQKEVELQAFKVLWEARLIDPTFDPDPSDALHRGAAYLVRQLEADGRIQVERFEGKKTIQEATAGQPDDCAEVEEIFALAGSAELAEVKRPLVLLEGKVIQKAYLMKGVPTSDVVVLEFDQVLMDTLVRLRGWTEGLGAVVDNQLDSKQKQIIPRTIKRMEEVRAKMLKAHAKEKEILPPDTARRDLIRFVLDQVHRAEDALSMLGDRTYRQAYAETVFQDVCFRSAGPYLSKQYSIAIDTAVVAGADTQALVGKFKKDSSGPKPKRESAKIWSVIIPCYSQDGVTIRPATVRVGDFSQ